ncbi:expressed unknown protein [Seminavis robusta]|uniref:RING-type domain-containing protein n=1 Tax=Seminavis robusta TaxID=568900 RepID=A0A9N8EFM1_9STRA|nr:expressed unknown protein [Seminavis robusta]|eukprot:Sro1123_g243730.1 n/a (225) ;mRNA; r:34900-35680
MAPTQSDYEGAPLIAHIHDPNEENMPSIKFGWEVLLGAFAVIVAVAALIAAFLLFCSRTQEHGATKQEEAKKKQALEDLKSNMECKPWSTHSSQDDRTEKTADPSEASRYSIFDSDSISSYFLGPARSSSALVDVDDVEMQMQEISMSDQKQESACTTPVSTDGAPKDKDGTCCPICNDIFEYGQPVYTSNNCGHQCHKVCMDRWLKFQNTRPVCNEAFVLRVV